MIRTRVICSPEDARAILGAVEYGRAIEGFWLTNVQCDGTEYDVIDCPHSPWGNILGCDLTEPAGVTCTQEIPPTLPSRE